MFLLLSFSYFKKVRNFNLSSYFRCYECKEHLEENDKCFFNRGKIWCESHYYWQKTCSGCKKTIESDQWVSAVRNATKFIAYIKN